MAEQLYHAFTLIHGMWYRVVVYAEQRVEDRWVEMSSTELATFSRPNRQPRMPSRPPPSPPPPAAQDQVVPQGPPPPPPPAAAGSEDQLVPQGPPEQPSNPPPELAEPNRDAPGAMRTRSRAREARVVGQRRSPPPRPSRRPLARTPPPSHRILIPAWAVLANDIWFACPICAEAIAHSGVVCGQCGRRPACCECLISMELSRYSEGRCPFCRYAGPQQGKKTKQPF
jgi:hypothetical protein